MLLSASSLTTNIIVTVFVALFVILLPLFDRHICSKLGVQPEHLIRGNSRESTLLRLRLVILFLIFLLYLLANVWLVFFSRAATEDYLVHVAPMEDLRNAIHIDSGILGLITEIYTEGISHGLSQVHIEKPEDLAQVYMNIMLYVPMGYLLPYLFSWVRARVKFRPVFICFVLSFITENLQLIFRRGFYDIDDLLSNTLGGLIGQLLFIALAFVASNPDWRKDLHAIRRWRHTARRTLFPVSGQMGYSRSTIAVTKPEVISDFFVQKLGFRPVRRVVFEDTGDADCLLQLGAFQLEILCPAQPVSLTDQYLTIGVKNIVRVRKRLNRLGIDAGNYRPDVFTGSRTLCIDGPELIHIIFQEV